MGNREGARAGVGACADRNVSACGGERGARGRRRPLALLSEERAARTSTNCPQCHPLRLRIVESGDGRERSVGNWTAPTAPAQGRQNPEELQPGFGHRKGIGALREKGRVVVGVVHRGRRESVAAEFGPPDTPRGQFITRSAQHSPDLYPPSTPPSLRRVSGRSLVCPPLFGVRESPAVRRNASAHRRPHLPLGRPRRSRGRGRRIRGPARRADLHRRATEAPDL